MDNFGIYSSNFWEGSLNHIWAIYYKSLTWMFRPFWVSDSPYFSLPFRGIPNPIGGKGKGRGRNGRKNHRCFPKIMGKTPQIIHFNKVFSYKQSCRKSKTKQRMVFRMIHVKDSRSYQWAKFDLWTSRESILGAHPYFWFNTYILPPSFWWHQLFNLHEFGRVSPASQEKKRQSPIDFLMFKLLVYLQDMYVQCLDIYIYISMYLYL